MTLDEFDYKILNQLKKNARMAYATIGKDIGLTAPAVAKRVQKMELGGLIKGYTLDLDHSKLGNSIKALITIKMGFPKRNEFEKKVHQFESIQTCYRVTGEDCMVMEVLLRDNEHLVTFLDELAAYGITKTNIVLNDLMDKKK